MNAQAQSFAKFNKESRISESEYPLCRSCGRIFPALGSSAAAQLVNNNWIKKLEISLKSSEGIHYSMSALVPCLRKWHTFTLFEWSLKTRLLLGKQSKLSRNSPGSLAQWSKDRDQYALERQARLEPWDVFDWLVVAIISICNWQSLLGHEQKDVLATKSGKVR